MNIKQYKQIRAAVALFIGLTVSIAVTQNSYLLSIISVLVGMLFLALVRSRTKITIDEREKTIREKAAQLTYAIFAPTIGLGSFFCFVFGKDRYPYLSSIGIILSYLTLFLIGLYAICYHLMNKQFGGGGNEE